MVRISNILWALCSSWALHVQIHSWPSSRRAAATMALIPMVHWATTPPVCEAIPPDTSNRAGALAEVIGSTEAHFPSSINMLITRILSSAAFAMTENISGLAANGIGRATFVRNHRQLRAMHRLRRSRTHLHRSRRRPHALHPEHFRHIAGWLLLGQTPRNMPCSHREQTTTLHRLPVSSQYLLF